STTRPSCRRSRLWTVTSTPPSSPPPEPPRPTREDEKTMDINNDELRRELRDLDQEHRQVMPRWRDSLMRLLVDDKETPTEAKAFEAKIAALKTEQDVLNFAFALEQIAAETYQGVGMKLSTPTLRQTAMTVGGVEARHMAILAHFITPRMTVPAVAFQPIDKAVDSSFYV